MKLPSFTAIFRTAKKEVGLAGKSVASIVSKVSPVILQDLKPILASAETQLWTTAYPLAVQIVVSVAKNGLNGFDAHSAAVKQLEAAVLATGKTVLTSIEKLHLGQIILAAYANSPAILAALSAAGVAL
jgi:hypothetical protein